MTVREAFEAWYADRYCKGIPMGSLFQRSSLFGQGGYSDPTVNFMWEGFKAGFSERDHRGKRGNGR